MESVNVESLHALIEVADSGSFSQAGERLHLTQPAVSKRIAALESELGVRLFDRLGRQVLLTEAGRTLLPRARRILVELEDSRRALSNLAGNVAGPLRVAISHHIGLHRLPSLLRTYTLRFPNVRLELDFTDSELACEAVARGEMELALATLPPKVPPPLLARPVWDDPLVICVGHDHCLATESRIKPATISRHPAILPQPATYTRGVIDHFFQQRGLTLRQSFATNYLETIKMLVVVGLGWSLLPSTMANGELRVLQLVGGDLRRSLGMVRHAGHTLSNAAVALLELLPGPDGDAA